MLARWTAAVASERFDTVGDLRENLAFDEQAYERWSRAENTVYVGLNLQRLVALRVVCGSRPREELVADIDGVLADPQCDSYGTVSSRRGKPPSQAEFFTALREYVDVGDRGAVAVLIEETRTRTLRIFGIPDELVDPIELPEPEVAW